MGKPQSAAKLQQTGGALAGDPDKDLICKAFAEAVKDTCGGRSLGANRSFNDYFFKHLANQGSKGQAIAGAIEREVPFILERTASGLQFAGTAANVAANGSGPAQALASTVTGSMATEAAAQGLTGPLTGLGPWSGVGNALLGAGATAWRTWGLANYGATVTSKATGLPVQIIKNPAAYPRFADGVYKNKVLELKGPKDKLSGRQAGDARRCSGGNDPYVVSCQSCDVNCSNGCPKAPAVVTQGGVAV